MQSNQITLKKYSVSDPLLQICLITNCNQYKASDAYSISRLPLSQPQQENHRGVAEQLHHSQTLAFSHQIIKVFNVPNRNLSLSRGSPIFQERIVRVLLLKLLLNQRTRPYVRGTISGKPFLLHRRANWLNKKKLWKHTSYVGNRRHPKRVCFNTSIRYWC